MNNVLLACKGMHTLHCLVRNHGGGADWLAELNVIWDCDYIASNVDIGSFIFLIVIDVIPLCKLVINHVETVRKVNSALPHDDLKCNSH